MRSSIHNSNAQKAATCLRKDVLMVADSFPSRDDYREWIIEGEQRGLDMGSLLICNPFLSDVYLEYEEEKQKSLKPYGYRGFVFYPSYLGVYETLKEVDPTQALEFLETLICYGVKDELPPDIAPYIKALLLGPMKAIDKAWINYLTKSSRKNNGKGNGDMQ